MPGPAPRRIAVSARQRRVLERIVRRDTSPQHQVRRAEYEYIRHGTLSFMINFDVATGQVVAPSCGPTRTEEDFTAHIRQTVQSDPAATGWHIVTDNLNIHVSEALVRSVAAARGISDDLGIKGKR